MSWGKERIKELRKKLGLSQSELAQNLGCRQQTVSEWELGMYAPANAYGRLLDQISGQLTASLARSENRRPAYQQKSTMSVNRDAASGQKVTRHVQGMNQETGPAAEGAENEFYENTFDRVFDPGID